MWISAIVLAAALAMFAFERLRPARPLERVPGWWGRVVLLNGIQVAVVWLAGTAWDPWFARVRPWSADALGTTGGALAGYVAITLVYYVWHRARHAVPLLWRLVHQVHHSPRRIEVVTSFYKHPLEVVLNGVLSSAVLYLAVGLGPSAAACAVLISGLAELVYHWNVRTPHWLGYVFQRPEMHRIHHAEGSHRGNYADLPLWDMLGGTYRNPREGDVSCGFAEGREQHLARMLRGVDVHAEERPS